MPHPNKNTAFWLRYLADTLSKVSKQIVYHATITDQSPTESASIKKYINNLEG